MATITSSGANGIDVNSLVSQLVAAERQAPDARLATRENKAQAKLSAYGSLKSGLAAFQEALQKMKTGSSLQGRLATASNTTLLSASATSAAVPGEYTLSVERLAQTHKIASAGYAAGTSVVGTGTLSISAGGSSFSVAIDDSNSSLSDIRDAINRASGNAGVKASIVNSEEGSHLVLTSTASGAAGQITVAVTTGGSDTGNLSALAFDPGAGSNAMTEKMAAQDARIIVDGFARTSATNTFTDVIDGLTFNALKAQPGESLTVKVSDDQPASRKAIEGFVAAYNSLQGSLASMTGYNAATKAAGQLQGDATTLRLASLIRNELNTAVSGASAEFDTLAELGLTTQVKDGTLAIDSTRLDKVLSANFDQLSAFFSGSDGLASRLEATLKPYSSSDGLIDARTSGLKSEVTGISKQKEALDVRMDAIEARYLKQFNALDTLLTQLNGTSNYLSTQLGALTNLNKN